jgi:hypothetical protein
MESFEFNGEIWRHAGEGGWHFVTLPKQVADGIRFFRPTRGFMPVAVQAQIGDVTWKTSVFPDSRSGSFLLAIKANVRKSLGIGHGDDVRVRLRLVDA